MEQANRNAELFLRTLLSRIPYWERKYLAGGSILAQNTAITEMQEALDAMNEYIALGDTPTAAEFLRDILDAIASELEGSIISVIASGDNLEALRALFAQINRLAEQLGGTQISPLNERQMQRSLVKLLPYTPRLEDIKLYLATAEYSFASRE